jgi:hypothetical protein
MKSLRELVNRKKAGQGRGLDTGKEDERHVEKLFMYALGRINNNISRSDFKRFYLKKEILYVRATHPSIASEIWRSRERIVKEINMKAEEEIIRTIKIN